MLHWSEYKYSNSTHNIFQISFGNIHFSLSWLNCWTHWKRIFAIVASILFFLSSFSLCNRIEKIIHLSVLFWASLSNTITVEIVNENIRDKSIYSSTSSVEYFEFCLFIDVMIVHWWIFHFQWVLDIFQNSWICV